MMDVIGEGVHPEMVHFCLSYRSVSVSFTRFQWYQKVFLYRNTGVVNLCFDQNYTSIVSQLFSYQEEYVFYLKKRLTEKAEVC